MKIRQVRCPKCKSLNVQFIKTGWFFFKFHVQCNLCGYKTKFHKNFRKALYEWVMA